jgi:hypothetical protein
MGGLRRGMDSRTANDLSLVFFVYELGRVDTGEGRGEADGRKANEIIDPDPKVNQRLVIT